MTSFRSHVFPFLFCLCCAFISGKQKLLNQTGIAALLSCLSSNIFALQFIFNKEISEVGRRARNKKCSIFNTHEQTNECVFMANAYVYLQLI